MLSVSIVIPEFEWRIREDAEMESKDKFHWANWALSHTSLTPSQYCSRKLKPPGLRVFVPSNQAHSIVF